MSAADPPGAVGSDGTVIANPVLPDAAELVGQMRRAVAGDPPPAGSGLGGLVLELVRSNLRQWDLEDATRDPHSSDAAVANGKRAIDRLNLQRHRLVQEIDVAIAAAIEQPTTATLATESPGMVLDRLSVLVIRHARTAAASSRDWTYAQRLPALDGQLVALSAALDSYLQELQAGTRRFLPYEHLKLYAGGPSAAPPG